MYRFLLFLCVLPTVCLTPAHSARAQTSTQTLAVAVSEDGGNVFRRFLVDKDGRMTSNTRFRMANPNEAYTDFVCFGPNGRFVYVASSLNGKSAVYQYRVEADGSLSLAASPAIVGFEASCMVFAPDGVHAYVLCRNGIWQFRQQPDGQLIALTHPFVVTGSPTQKHDVRKDITKPGEKYSTYEIENEDALSPASLVFAENGRQAFVINREYFYKGTERVIPNWAVQGGGTFVDVSHSIKRLDVSKTGELAAATAAPVAVDLGVTSLSSVPGGQFLYAEDREKKTTFVCKVRRDGSVSSPTKLDVAGNTLDFTPSVRFAYVALNDTLQPCTVQADGRLLPLTPALRLPHAVENTERNLSVIDHVQVDRTGRFLFAYYATDSIDHAVAEYVIQANGHLSDVPQSFAEVGSQLSGVMALVPTTEVSRYRATKTQDATPAVSPSHHPEFAYLLNADDGEIRQYAVTDTGALAPLAPPDVKIKGGLFPQGFSRIAADPEGHYLYLTDPRTESVLQYKIGRDGTLTPLPTTTHFKSPTYPTDIVIDPSERFAFVSTYYTSAVAEFAIGSDGLLGPEAIRTLSYVREGVTERELFLAAKANLLFVPHGNNYIDSYRIADDGSVALLSSYQTNLGQPFAFDPSGKFAFYGDGYGAVWQFLVSPQGAVSENVPRSVPADAAPEGVAADPLGHFVYAANGGDFYGDGSISQYRLGPDGKLTPLSPPYLATGTSPDLLTVDVTGRFLYSYSSHRHFPLAPASANAQEEVSLFRVNSDGTLTSNGKLEIKKEQSGQDGIQLLTVQPHT